MEIKFAGTETSLKSIIDKSLTEYRNASPGIHNEAKYILNMIVTLKSEVSSKHAAENVLENLNSALIIFKNHYIKSYIQLYNRI